MFCRRIGAGANGWTAGAGAEWAVGNSNLTFKLEYLTSIWERHNVSDDGYRDIGWRTPSSLTVRFSDPTFTSSASG
jgi:opacity protein-like surface antigen